MNIIDSIQAEIETLVSWRHALHQRPEIAFEEFWTSDFIADKLDTMGVEYQRGLATTGIVATISGEQGPGISIGLRADMDALNIQESNNFKHKSVHPGKMHACGHDGHCAMLLGAVKHFSENKSFKGTIHFIFQPAEENEGGARVMIEQGLFEKHPMQEVYGMHNMPGLAVGKMKMKPGPAMAGADSFDIIINSQGTHAAMPHRGTDPIIIQAQLVLALQNIVSRNLNPVETAVISVTQVSGGSTYNVIPERVNIKGTVRSFSQEVQNMVQNRIAEICQHLGACHNANIEFSYTKRYPPLVNSSDRIGPCQRAAAKVFGTENVDINSSMTMGSEDFAFMLQKKPGCYVFIGNGDGDENNCMLHNPNYDFNDQILTAGASYWVHLAHEVLAN